jgi:hypothetical protein
MDDSYVEDAYEDAFDAFERTLANPETGLDVDDPVVLQLRKACRLLDAADFLLVRNGHYTVIIESSFIAIERSIQFYVRQAGLHISGQDHTEVYERAVDAGLYSRAFAENLIGLWRSNRARTYYRQGIGSERRARAMYELASAVHRYIVDLTASQDCICST